MSKKNASRASIEPSSEAGGLKAPSLPSTDLELLLCVFARVPVGVVFHSQLAVRLFDVALAGVAWDTEDLVIVTSAEGKVLV